MATNAKACNIVAHTSYIGYNARWDPDGYETTWSAYLGAYQASGVMKFIYLLKFTTPNFSGVMESIKFLFNWHHTGSSDYTVNQRVRYAISASDENKDLYLDMYAEAADEYKIASGETTWEVTRVTPTAAADFKELTIETTKLQPNTTYYLFLTPMSVHSEYLEVYKTSDVMADLNYNVHSARIEIGSELKRCLCYIDNGESWLPIAPNVDNGTGWDACS